MPFIRTLILCLFATAAMAAGLPVSADAGIAARVDAAIARLAAGDPEQRYAARLDLLQLPPVYDPEIHAEIERVLLDRLAATADPLARVALVRALGAYGGAASAAPLGALLAGADAGLAAEALLALAPNPAPAATAVLTDALARATDSSRCGGLIDALGGRLDCPVEMLAARLADADPAVAGALALALARTPQAAALAALQAAYAAAGSLERADLLGRAILESPLAGPELREQMGLRLDLADGARVAVPEPAPDAARIAELEAVLTTGDRPVRAAAARAYATLAAPGLDARLLGQLDSATAAERLAVMPLLAARNPPGANARLLAIAGAADAGVDERAAALAALEAIAGMEELDGLLALAAAEPAAEVRAAAQRAARRIVNRLQAADAVWPLLADAFAAAASPEHTLGLLAILEAAPAPAALPLLDALSRGAPGPVMEAAAALLANWPDQEALAWIRAEAAR
jgi:hypothetical protein